MNTRIRWESIFFASQAFFPAAIVDLIQKLRKKEEMAIISFAFLLFSMISFGLVLQFAIAFMIAKQLENYFKPNYPLADLVKSFEKDMNRAAKDYFSASREGIEKVLGVSLK